MAQTLYVKTLYDKIQARGQDLTEVKAQMDNLESRGLHVTGTVPILRDEAKRLCGSSEYSNNPIVQRNAPG